MADKARGAAFMRSVFAASFGRLPIGAPASVNRVDPALDLSEPAVQRADLVRDMGAECASGLLDIGPKLFQFAEIEEVLKSNFVDNVSLSTPTSAEIRSSSAEESRASASNSLSVRRSQNSSGKPDQERKVVERGVR